MGGLCKAIPFTWAMMLIGNLALTGVGIPYLGIGLAGFYSKDAIINAAYGGHSGMATYAFILTAGRGRHDQLLFLAAVPDDLPWPLSRAGSSASGACRRRHAHDEPTADDHGEHHAPKLDGDP